MGPYRLASKEGCALNGPIPPHWTPYLQGLLRIVVALLFITHGTQKLFNVPVGTMGPVPLASKFGVAGILETFGGLAALLGLWFRPVAFLLSGEMAVAYFTAHAPRALWPLLNGGELAVLYCFIWLFFAAAGPGAFTVRGKR
jgi:putative oxidoreductase